MKINKILTPLERVAKTLFKDTVGNDLGKKKRSYLTKNSQTDIFVREKIQKSVNRRKW